jgi:DNA polymerase
MTTVISVDFETRSTVDLRKTGVYPYADHPNTGVWCMAYALDDRDPLLWVAGDEFPQDLQDAIHEGAELRAWNAQFERVMWERHMVPRHGWLSLDVDRWYDTAAEAAAMALPRNLGHCAQVLGVSETKDEAGHNLMMRMSRPRKLTKNKIIWWEDLERKQQLYEYCIQDVRTERAIAKALRRLDDRERAIYLLDQKINDRGVLVDVSLARAMRIVARMGLDEANDAVREATDGAVEKVTKVADLTKWLRDSEGLDIDNVRKDTVRDLLLGEVSDPARRALEARADAGRSSVAKIESAMVSKCADNRIRGMLLYHGASTGRWSGKGFQPHNLPRGDVDNPEQYIDLLLRKDYAGLDAHHPPLAIISSLLRGLLIAGEGRRLEVGDFSQIEARVLAWLAGQEDLVEAFASGAPVYERMAEEVLGFETGTVTKAHPARQMGKAIVLGCGFGMGAEKFVTTARTIYGVDVSQWPEGVEPVTNAEGEELPFSQHIINLYRRKNSNIVNFWYRLGDAALDAVARPGEVQVVRGCKLVVRGAYLWLVLPSRRPLAYTRPKIEDRRAPWGEMKPNVKVWGVNSMSRKWEARWLYGGLLTENVVQALARDIMADAMLRLEEAGYPTILTVHDEVVAEPRMGHGSPEEFIQIMSQTPTWADGCPIEVEGWTGRRYRKA